MTKIRELLEKKDLKNLQEFLNSETSANIAEFIKENEEGEKKTLSFSESLVKKKLQRFLLNWTQIYKCKLLVL